MAPITLRYFPLGQFLGDLESAEAITLPAALSSGGSKNLVIDKLARATTILGYSQRNATIVTSNIGATPMRLRALYHYVLRDPATGVITRQELGVFDSGAGVVELRLSTNNGQTWSFVGYLNAGIADVGIIPDFAQQGNALSITTGAGPVLAWDGTTLSAASTPRINAPTITDAGAGQISGAPVWRIVPIRTDGTRKVASPSSLQTVFDNRKVVITWVADTDPTVSGYEVYRSTGSGGLASGAGISGILFLLGTVSGIATVTFTDNVNDLDLISGRVLQEYGDSPPSGAKYAEVSKQRTWYLNIPLYPRRGYWSDPGLPYSVFTDSSFFDFTDAESFSDECTGATGNFQNFAQIVWLERSVWTVSGTGEYNGNVIDLQRKRSDARTGTVHNRTVVRVPAGAKYINETGAKQSTSAVMLAYMTPLADVRLFDGSNDLVISAPKVAAFQRLTYAARRKAFALQDHQRSEITWVFPADSSLEPSFAVTWNYLYGVWYDRPGWASLACALETETATDAVVLLAGEVSLAIGGYCYRLWDGPTFNGTAINARYVTGTLYGSVNYYDRGLTDITLLSWQKRWRWAEFLVKLSGGPLTLLIEWLPTEAGNDDPPYGSQTITLGESNLETSDLSLLTSEDGSQLQAIVSPTMVRVQLRATPAVKARYMHSRGIRLRFSSTTTSVQWSLVGGNIAYQLLASGANRTFRR